MRKSYRHPYRGEMNCDAADRYREQVRDRQEQELKNVAKLTGWKRSDIYTKVKWLVEGRPHNPQPWWRDVFDD